MARLPRIVVPGQPLHIIQRGNNHQTIFFADEDYYYFLECLVEAGKRHGCIVHSYVLMTNHVHLLVTPCTEYSPSRWMQAIGRRYVRYINKSYRRSGTLWEGRYKSSIIDSKHYLLTCSKYIELNPVRACMVKHPIEYRWSSYHCNANGVQDPLVVPHTVYKALGNDVEQRSRVYRDLFSVHIDNADLDCIRQAANTNGVLGNEHYREKIEGTVQCRVKRHDHGGDRKSKRFRELSSTLTP